MQPKKVELSLRSAVYRSTVFAGDPTNSPGVIINTARHTWAVRSEPLLTYLDINKAYTGLYSYEKKTCHKAHFY